MIYRHLFPRRQRQSRGLLLLGATAIVSIAALSLTGCHTIFPSAPAPKPPVPVVTANGILQDATAPTPGDPTRFAWEDRSLEATGEAQGTRRGGAASAALRARAKAAGLRQLIAQVKSLQINGEATVGAAMASAIAVNKAVEDAIKSNAQTTAEDTLPGGGIAVRLQVPLSSVAAALRRYYITPTEPLPETPQTDPSRLMPVA